MVDRLFRGKLPYKVTTCTEMGTGCLIQPMKGFRPSFGDDLGAHFWTVALWDG